MSTVPGNGWPSDLADSHHADFHIQAANWLLDRLPSEFRVSEVRSNPVALAWVLHGHIEGQITTFRHLYATARGQTGISNVTILLDGLSSVGAALLRTKREVMLVAAALGSSAGGTAATDLD